MASPKNHSRNQYSRDSWPEIKEDDFDISVYKGKSQCLMAADCDTLTNQPPHYAAPSRFGRHSNDKVMSVKGGKTEEGTKMKYSVQDVERLEKEGLEFDPQSWRALSVREYERLQTLPEGYTEGLSRREAVNVIGDGWTIKVIEYILSGIKEE